MQNFTIFHGYIVDCRPDGAVGINARIYAAVDKGDESLEGAAALVRQANAAALMLPILERLSASGDSEAQEVLSRIRDAERRAAPKVMP